MFRPSSTTFREEFYKEKYLMASLKYKCAVIVLLDIYDISSHYLFFFVENFPENDWKRPKHVGDSPYVCILL